MNPTAPHEQPETDRMGQCEIEQNPSEWMVRLQPRDSVVYTTQNRTVMATGRDGFIFRHAEQGLWFFQTRLVSQYRWFINGKPARMVANSNVQQHSWLGYYIASPAGIRDEGHDEADPSQQTIELRLTRFVADGVHEDVDVTSFTQRPSRVELQLEIESDFADHAEAKSGKREQQGKLESVWRPGENNDAELHFDYQAEHRYEHQGDRGVARLHRALTLRIHNAGSAPQYRDGCLTFRFELPPHDSWHACLSFHPQIYDLPRPGVGLAEMRDVEYSCRSFFGVHNEYDARRAEFFDTATRFSAGHDQWLEHVVVGALERSRRDLIGLRLYDLDRDSRAWTVAAGLPIYVGMFGRDILASSWEASLLGPEMLKGSLATLPRWQGDRTDDWRDEDPGKLPHEAHTGPLSTLNFTPHGLYYGGVTGSVYYPTVVAALWHWTGNKEIVEPFIEPALRGLAWADKYGDLDGDGFYEYETRSKQGEKNQGWKDSGDAIVYADGSQVQDPLGTCEMQAFAYVSKLHFSEVLWWLDRKDEAWSLFQQAEELRKRFNDRFWMEDEQYIAMALDSHKHQVKSIASDPGHCLASGIVDISRVKKVAARLMQPDMFSGWGVRTLSADHPAFNPYAYHRGTVWPVENGVFALGFARYGMHDHVNTLCRGMFEAASLFQYYRLPECLAGHERDTEHPFPAMYPNANWPQAWSASAVFTMIQAMLGLYPYAPLHTLLLDPWLPEWLPNLTVNHLRVGEAVVTLRFYRKKDGTTDFEVLEKRGHLHVIRQPSPQSLTSGFGERVRDAVESLLPGK